MIRIGGLGDLLVALPSMAGLRRILPEKRLVLVCRGAYGGLLLDSGVADGVLPLESGAAAFLFGASAGQGPVPAEAYSLAVGWAQTSSRSGLESVLRGMGIPSVLISAPDPFSSIPIQRRFFDDTVAALARRGGSLPDFDECARLVSVKGGMAEARARSLRGIPPGGKIAVIHPGSGGAAKIWPFERFLEISRRLQVLGIPGVFITGEAEERPEISGRLERVSLPPGWAWLRMPPLLAVAGLLAEAPLYVGNDSGITHLAAACGARVTALFLEMNIPAWKPYGRSRVLTAKKLTDLDTESVWAAVLAEKGT